MARIGVIVIKVAHIKEGEYKVIKRQVKCPRCGKVLLRAYSTAIRSITCSCGNTIDMKKFHKEDEEECQKQN